MSSICRIYTDPITSVDTLLDVMDACIAIKLPFYYSSMQNIIRAESRSIRRILKLEQELRLMKISYTKSYYRK